MLRAAASCPFFQNNLKNKGDNTMRMREIKKN